MKKKQKGRKQANRRLRAGSKTVKKVLYAQDSRCDICKRHFSIEVIQLHHIKMIRWGYPTDINFCRLLCPNCHREYHCYDHFLDMLHANNPNTDFLKIYEQLKEKIRQKPP